MELNTLRLRLREIELKDWQNIYDIQSDPDYIEKNPWEQQSADKVRGLVNMFLIWKNEIPRTQFQFAVINKENDEFIGTTGIHSTSVKHREAEFGIRLKPDCWGLGFAKETLEVMLKFAFEELKLHRICAETIADNLPAVDFCRLNGFVEEGRFRQNKFRHGQWYDSLRFALLEPEWKNIRKHQSELKI